MEREPVEKMLGDGFREVGVLVLVFALLDRILSGNITIRWTLAALALGILFFCTGLYIERRRRDE